MPITSAKDLAVNYEHNLWTADTKHTNYHCYHQSEYYHIHCIINPVPLIKEKVQ